MSTPTFNFTPKKSISTGNIGEMFHNDAVYIDGTITFSQSSLGGIPLQEIDIEVTLCVKSATFRKTSTTRSSEISVTGKLKISTTEFKFTLTRETDNLEWGITLTPLQSIDQSDSGVTVAITSPDMINIKPSDIIIPESGAVGNFGKNEVEVAAGNMIAFFRERGAWCIFTKLELETFDGPRGFDATETLRWVTPYLVETSESGFAITKEFIQKCVAK